MFLMIAISIYSLGYAFELVNDTVEGVFFALKIEYLGIVSLPVFWFLLAFKYTGYDRRANIFVHIFLFIIPLITIVLLFTNNIHHFYYSSLGINREGSFPIAIIIKGPWYYVHIIYTNILLVSGTVLFIRMIIQTTGIFRKQAIMMLIISLLPWIGNILYLMGFGPYGIDLNPFFLTISGPLFAVALFKYGMFNITPIARKTVFEEMRDPVIVIDNRYRIADFNKSALNIFPDFGINLTGLVIDELLTESKALITQIHSGSSDSIEVILEKENVPVYYHSTITELFSFTNKIIGKIITFHDISEQKRILRKLHNLATTDELTNLYNRRHFMKVSQNELVRSRRYKRPVSFLMIDLDYFKKVNDNYGHQAGDEVLIETAAVFKDILRDNDIVARYGGEEFTAMLPEINSAGAVLTAERIRKEIDEQKVSFRGIEIKITISIGISTCSVERYSTIENDDFLLEKLLSEADEALYTAKVNGRNRVVPFK